MTRIAMMIVITINTAWIPNCINLSAVGIIMIYAKSSHLYFVEFN